MSFLKFRSARRRAKKVVSTRPHRPPTPPSPGSFASPDFAEPTRASPEDSSIHTTNQVDVEVTHGSRFPGDPFFPSVREYRLVTKSRDFFGGLLSTGPGRNGVSPSKPSPDDVGLEQRRVRVLALARCVS